MSIVQIEAQVSADELLKAVSQFTSAELEQFTAKVIVLRAQRQAPGLPRAEAELLLKINQGLPAPLQQRYEALIVRRQAEALTADEHIELLRLTEQIEALEAARAEALAELARLRRTSVTGLMRDLGLAAPAYA